MSFQFLYRPLASTCVSPSHSLHHLQAFYLFLWSYFRPTFHSLPILLLHPFIYLFSPHPFIPTSFYLHWFFPIAGLSIRITLQAYFSRSIFPSPIVFPLAHHISPAPSYFPYPKHDISLFQRSFICLCLRPCIFFFAQENWITKGQQRKQWMFRRNCEPRRKTGVSNRSFQSLNLKCVLDI